MNIWVLQTWNKTKHVQKTWEKFWNEDEDSKNLQHVSPVHITKWRHSASLQNSAGTKHVFF